MTSFGARAARPPESTECGRAARAPKGWHSRGYLPHFDSPDLIQSITFRLADSLPQEKLESWRKDSRCKPERQLSNAVENYLDRSYGNCVLNEPRVAQIVENNLLYFDGSKYKMLAWCIMPNHVHTLLEVVDNWGLSEIVHSWKSFTAKQANALVNSRGRFWQEDYFDRYIRDERHFNRALYYIENNPVKAGLCANSADWRWSSAQFRDAM